MLTSYLSSYRSIQHDDYLHICLFHQKTWGFFLFPLPRMQAMKLHCHILKTEQWTLETSYLGTPWLVVDELQMLRGFKRKRRKLGERRTRWNPLHVTKYQCELLSICETEITLLMELSPSCSGNKLCCQQEAFMSCKLSSLKRHCSLLTHSPTEGSLVLWGMCRKCQWLIQKQCVSMGEGQGLQSFSHLERLRPLSWLWPG